MNKRIRPLLSWMTAIIVLTMLPALLLASRAGAYFPMTLLEAPIALLARPVTTQAQAIVVLGGGVGRERYGAQLRHETGLPILFSGAGNEFRVRKLASELKVPQDWIEDLSTNTEENAKFSAPILKQHGMTRIVLVTNGYHMLRARMMFEYLGYDVTTAPVSTMEPEPLSLKDFIPSCEGWMRSQLARHEIGGMAWFKIRHPF